MPVFTIETPDGRKLDIEADDENGAVAGAKDWVTSNPKPAMQAAGELAAPFHGFNKGVDALVNLPGTVLNLGAGAVNYGAEKLGYEPPLPAQPFKPVPIATNANTDYEPQTTLGRYGETIGEVAGSAILPEAGILAKAGSLTPQAMRTAAPIFERAAQVGPAKMLKSSVVPTVGAGTGVQAARDLELGPVAGPIAEMAAGFAGGFAAPLAYAPLARVGGGIKSGVRYAKEQVQAARNPEESAIQRTADNMVETRTPPSEIRSQLLSDANGNPLLSNELAARGITEEHLADMIGRRLQGEAAETIAAEYGVAPGTVNSYAARLNRNTPTPMNIADIVTELRGPGGAMPVLRQGRTAFGIADDSADAAQALYNRQTEQSGRTADIIQRSGGPGRRFEDELERLQGTARQEEQAAYRAAYEQAAPVQLENTLRAARLRAHGRAGEIGDKLNEAADLFFEPVAVPKRISALQDVLLREMQERINTAAERGASPERIAQLQRRYDAMRDDLEFRQNARPEVRRTDRPIQDLRRFVDARQELDQLIQRSMQDHQATPLTRLLTEFRRQINDAARSNNQALLDADTRFAGNRSAQSILERGSELGKRLTPETREAMRDFRQMTPAQQELMRVAFERRLADDALNTRTTGGAANQFSTQAFRQIVEAFYPAPARGLRGAERAAAQAVHNRGQALLRNLNREAITTGTGNFITGRGNSPTAVWSSDIEGQMQNARAAADFATGRFGRVLENLSNRLARQIGKEAAAAQLRILTETNRPDLLLLLNRLERAAAGTARRRELVHQLRELRRTPQPATAIGTGVSGLLR